MSSKGVPALALAACAAFLFGIVAPAPAATVVRIGLSNSDVAAEPLYAQTTGIFRRAGLDAALTNGMQGSAVIAGLKAGTIDIGFVNIVSTAGAIQRGDPFVLLAPGALYRSDAPITVLVQSPRSHFRTGADLNGKRIATPSGKRDLGTIGTEAWIDAHGGDSRSVRFVTGIPLHAVGAALAAHRIDASELTEPELSAQRRAGVVTLVAPTFDAVGSGFIIGGFVTTRAWVRAHPAAARRFIAAMAETARWANAHHAQTAPILARRLKVAPALVASMVRATYPAALTPAIVQPPLDAAANYHVIAPMHAAELIERE
jgi:ABC-type nitrate/sulfonate/bicarbonate transport system substrate-binding protein